MSPYTFLRAIGPEPWNAAYVRAISVVQLMGVTEKTKPSLPTFHQFQVVMKPSPSKHQELYLESLEKLGINPLEPTISVSLKITWGKPSNWFQLVWVGKFGWTVWKSLQFTYFQQVGGLATGPVTSEVTYGLERLASYIKESILFTILSGLQALNTEKSSFNQNMNTQNTALKFLTKICFLKTLKIWKRSRACFGIRALFTQPMTTFWNVHTPSTCLTRVEQYQLQNVPATLPIIRNLARVVAKTFVAERKNLVTHFSTKPHAQNS